MMNVLSLARREGISNRPTESGTRWQTSGTFAIGEDGIVKWGGLSLPCRERRSGVVTC